MIDKKVLEEIVFTSPLVLLGIKDESIIKLSNEYLPYSTGFEIECFMKETYNESVFKSIPNIIWDSCQDGSEQRYRIPSGVNGLICLYNICYHLGNNSLLNKDSGIHYHIDCTDVDEYNLKYVASSDKDFIEGILEELESWKYGGKYNKKGISLHGGNLYGNWIRWNLLGTLEFRIGNMSFDYEVLVKQIIHANDIVRRWKNKIPNYNNNINYAPINYTSQIEYQKSIDIHPTSYEYKIRELAESLQKSLDKVVMGGLMTENDKQIVKKRLHKLY